MRDPITVKYYTEQHNIKCDPGIVIIPIDHIMKVALAVTMDILAHYTYWKHCGVNQQQ